MLAIWISKITVKKTLHTDWIERGFVCDKSEICVNIDDWYLYFEGSVLQNYAKRTTSINLLRMVVGLA